MGSMRVMNSKGDEPITWDSDDPETIVAAKEKFDELSEKGYSFFTPEGDKITEFDHMIENITAVAPMAGG